MRTARLALSMAALFSLASMSGDFLSPMDPEMQNLQSFFAPPTRIHFFDRSGRFHARPFVYRYELVNPLDIVYEERTETSYPLEFFRTGHSYRFLGFIPASRHLVGTSEDTFHPWGTDELGRDVLSRSLGGAKTSLLVVTLGIILYAVMGVCVGAAAGLAGGWTDFVLMRLSDFVLALPALYLILALRALLPLKMPFAEIILLTVATISAVTWPPMARGVRGLILQLRSAVYVEAARAVGCTRWHILRRHMLPALFPFVLAQAVVAAPVFILGEAVLSFLDVGLRDSGPSWGGMLRNLKDPRVCTDFWWNLAPLALVFAALICLNALGNRLATRTKTGFTAGF